MKVLKNQLQELNETNNQLNINYQIKVEEIQLLYEKILNYY